ncbi:MAG: phosphotransferase [Thermomicrobiales bacterium]
MTRPIPTPPVDPALPGLAVVLDGAAIASVLAEHLPDRADGRFTIDSCEPNYVRYKQATSCLVGYRVLLRDAENASVVGQLAHIRLYADDHARLCAESASLDRLVERAARHHPTPPLGRAAYVPSLHGLVQFFPVDRDLRSLVRATSRSKMRKILAAALPADAGRPLREPPVLVRYKPARKALVRYDLEGETPHAVYGKLLSDHHGADIHVLGRALKQQGIPTPEPLAYLPEMQCVVHAAAPGVPLTALRGDPRYFDALEPVVDLLSRLRAVSNPVLPPTPPDVETAAIRAAADAVAVLVPELASRAQRLAGGLCAVLTRLSGERALIHGDFYDDQILVAPDGVTLIDLDEARHGHPLIDVGNYLAHLTAAGGLDDARATFLDAYRRRNAVSSSDLALVETIGLLKLAVRPFRHLDPDWPDGIAALLDLAEVRWRDALKATNIVGADRCVRPRPNRDDRVLDAGRHAGLPLPDGDPLLPHLPVLGDPELMTTLISKAVYDAPVEILNVTLVRHKPGRRAIFRYDLFVGTNGDPQPERLFGKTFASERGPRVYEALRAIAAAQACGVGVRLPEPAAYLPDLKLLLQRAVPGEIITPALRAGDTRLATAMAEAIHTLHTSAVDLPRRHNLARELDPLEARVERLGTRSPALETVACRCLGLIERGRRRRWDWRWRPIHRDLYHDQVLAGDHGLSILDFDDAAISEPAVDVANLLAHLRLLAFQHPDAGDGPARVAAAFINRYRRLDPDLDPILVGFLEGATLLRLAEIHQPRADGDRITAALLDESERLLRLHDPTWWDTAREHQSRPASDAI